MRVRQHFLQIKRLFFPRWDRQDLWGVSTRSRRRVLGALTEAWLKSRSEPDSNDPKATS
jgi:hypothetical protein